ncbi:Rho termination factor N-terminal domain-containing protein [Marinilactibacillus psychrotolerans]|uniref:Rho termination factor N-terminal domain-containing protein n=1 Tax=Marinilactibacillus psychrotolerans TaxID=191770 RepID=UPI003883BE01
MEDKQYVAVEYFRDMEDENTEYDFGTIYPREGVNVPEERIQSLLTGKNRRNKKMIMEIKRLDPKSSKEEELEALKVDELKELAEQKEVEYDSKTTKPQLIKALLEAKE